MICSKKAPVAEAKDEPDTIPSILINLVIGFQQIKRSSSIANNQLHSSWNRFNETECERIVRSLIKNTFHVALECNAIVVWSVKRTQ